MPTKILILSDMEFDAATANRWGSEVGEWNPTVMELIKTKYEEAGYKLPTIVYWNLNARTNNFPVRQDEMEKEAQLEALEQARLFEKEKQDAAVLQSEPEPEVDSRMVFVMTISTLQGLILALNSSWKMLNCAAWWRHSQQSTILLKII